MGNRTLNHRVNSKVKPPPTEQTLLFIGKLAAATGVSRDGLRFYESLGLISSQRGVSGYRQYPRAMIDFVGYIRTAQRLGFTLAEIGRHARELRDSEDQEAGLAILMRQRIDMIENRIGELAALRDELALRMGQACALRPTLPG